MSYQSSLRIPLRSEQYERLRDSEGSGSPVATSPLAWPRTWSNASSWVSRDPHVASSFTQSYIRTRHPHIMELERKETEEQSMSPLRHASRTAAFGDAQESSCADGLEESLLFDYESAETTSAASQEWQPAAAAARSLPSWDASRLESIKETATYTVCVEQDYATSGTWQAAFNAVNVLCGVGLLVTPYALAGSGLCALLLLALIGSIACCTGYMLSQCMDSCRSITSYPDIGQAAFGLPGRLLVSVLLYLELFCCAVDFLILEGDNLSALFPSVQFAIGPWALTPKQSMILLAALIVLPSVWLRDLSLLSFFSVTGIFASLLLILLVALEGATVTGFPHAHPPLVVWSGVPVALGLFSFCFSGHAVFPSLYASMRHKQHFPRLLVTSFGSVVVMYAVMAVLGALMFGPMISENITLDMQAVAPSAVPTRLSMWLVIINPLTKLALTLTPVAMALEELINLPSSSWSFNAASVTLRTTLLGSTVVVAILVPFFAYVMSFIGAIMSMSISIILPCLFYTKICGAKLHWHQFLLAAAIALFGFVAGSFATYQSVCSIMGRY